jgi:carboxyl-terminal processing protease
MDKNCKELSKEYPKIDKYKEKFTLTEDMFQQLLGMADEEKIEFNEEQFNKSKELISLQIKALIAQNLFDMSEYFQIINDRNDSYREALNIINDDEQYYKILKGNN